MCIAICYTTVMMDYLSILWFSPKGAVLYLTQLPLSWSLSCCFKHVTHHIFCYIHFYKVNQNSVSGVDRICFTETGYSSCLRSTTTCPWTVSPFTYIPAIFCNWTGFYKYGTNNKVAIRDVVEEKVNSMYIGMAWACLSCNTGINFEMLSYLVLNRTHSSKFLFTCSLIQGTGRHHVLHLHGTSMWNNGSCTIWSPLSNGIVLVFNGSASAIYHANSTKYAYTINTERDGTVSPPSATIAQSGHCRCALMPRTYCSTMMSLWSPKWGCTERKSNK